MAFEIKPLAKLTLKGQTFDLSFNMKSNKKFKVIDNEDGTATIASAKSGIGFYNPFVLLKKDYKFSKSIKENNLKFSFIFLTILQSVDQSNRLTTASIQSIGGSFSIGRTAITTFINNLTASGILIKVSQGWYKVDEKLIIFKQDHEGYMALQSETKALQIINNYNTQNIQVVQKEGQSLKDTLISAREESFNNL